MPVRWDAQMDQRLLLVALKLKMIDANKVAAEWKNTYGDELAVTPKAITEHLAKLKRNLGGGEGGGNASPRKAATPKATPSKASKSAPKTPASSAKKRGKNMSDEDDSEAEAAMLSGEGESPNKRTKLSRRSASVPKKYTEDSDDEAVDEADFSGSTAADEKLEEKIVKDEANGGHGFEVDNMSDVSDFAPGV